MGDATQRPKGTNADEWHLFLCEYLDNRATGRVSDGLAFIAVQIAEAIDAERERCAKICEGIAERLLAMDDDRLSSPIAVAATARNCASAIRAGGSGG